jgi:hypothetical protein
VVFEIDPKLGLERQRVLERGGFWLLDILHWVVNEEQRATSAVEEEAAILEKWEQKKALPLLCSSLVLVLKLGSLGHSWTDLSYPFTIQLLIYPWKLLKFYFFSFILCLWICKFPWISANFILKSDPPDKLI